MSDFIVENIDCREGLQSLSNNSVHLIVTDPPYFIDKLDGNWNDKTIKSSTLKAGVVGGLPVGMKFNPKQGENLYSFLKPIADQFIRVLKPGGFCIVFSQARLYHRMGMALEDAGFEIRDMLCWQYEGQAKAFSQNHFIDKNTLLSAEEREQLKRDLDGWKTPQLKPQMEPMVLAQKPKEGTFVENWKKHGVGLMNTKAKINNKFPGNIIPVSKRDRIEDGLLKHPTTKPPKLIAHLIELFTQPGQTVLDPFMGSGAHGIASLHVKRHFIGFEMSAGYFRASKHRLSEMKAFLAGEL